MKRNVIIKATAFVLQSCIWLIFLISILLIIMVFHWHLNSGFYENFYLSNGFKAGLSFGITISSNQMPGISLGQLSSGILIWQVVRVIIMMILAIISLKIWIRIIHSVSGLKAFYHENIKAFKKLAIIGFIIVLVSSFNFGMMNGNDQWHFTIPFGALIYSFICYILREVFKEGLKLQEESNSFV